MVLAGFTAILQDCSGALPAGAAHNATHQLHEQLGHQLDTLSGSEHPYLLLAQALAAQRQQLKEEAERIHQQAQQDADAARAEADSRRAVLDAQAAQLADRLEALKQGEAELRAAKLELQLAVREQEHEEGLRSGSLSQHETQMVGRASHVCCCCGWYCA